VQVLVAKNTLITVKQAKLSLAMLSKISFGLNNLSKLGSRKQK